MANDIWTAPAQSFPIEKLILHPTVTLLQLKQQMFGQLGGHASQHFPSAGAVAGKQTPVGLPLR